MSVGGGVTPSVLDTLEFPAALERVAAHAVSPLGAARVRARTAATDHATIQAALAQVAELAARILVDDAIRAEPIPDIGPALELLAVPGSALEGLALAGIGRALAAARQHLETATPTAAALVLSQLTAPARDVLGVEAADAVTVAARSARLHL